MKIKQFIFIFFAALVFAFQAHAGKGRDLLESYLNKTDSMQAKFEQKLLDARGLLLQQSLGTFTLKRPGKFSWDYIAPYPQKIISNGEKIWIYDTELEQVSVKKYDQILSGAPVILLDQRKDLDQEFEVTDLGFSQEQHWVELKPKTTENEFKKIEVGMTETGLRTMKLLDSFDQTTVIEFSHQNVNLSLDDAVFNFVPPEDADVVGDF